jgi:hypothetical protein
VSGPRGPLKRREGAKAALSANQEFFLPGSNPCRESSLSGRLGGSEDPRSTASSVILRVEHAISKF